MIQTQIPTTCRQLVVHSDNSVGNEPFEIRPPGRGEVLVETVSTVVPLPGYNPSGGRADLAHPSKTRVELSKMIFSTQCFL